MFSARFRRLNNQIQRKCILLCPISKLQLTPNNSFLYGKHKTIRDIGSSRYREFELSGIRVVGSKLVKRMT